MLARLFAPILVIASCGGLLAFAYHAAPGGDFARVGAWYSLIPPLLAMALAVLTRQLALSMISSLIAAGIVVAYAQGAGPLELAWHSTTFVSGAIFKVVSDPWSWRVAVFVMLILTMSSIIILAGGLIGVAQHLERYAKGPRSTQFVTFLLGISVFIDDYASTMIVGAAMRPLSDRHRISREKLAFLVDATSAPVAGLAVVSTWIAFEVGLFERVSKDLNFGLNGYEMFFDAMSYRFYCLFLLLFMFIAIASQRDFGPMLRAEKRSRLSGQLIAPGAQPLTSSAYTLDKAHPQARPYARTAVVPLVLLLTVFVVGLWLSGGGFAIAAQDLSSLWRLSAWREVLAHSSNSVVLLSATTTGLVSACYFALRVARIPPALLWTAARGGARNALLPMGILVLAWALKQGFDATHLGDFLVHSVGDSIAPQWYPALVFALGAAISFGIGTSWGTMSLLIPIVVPLAYTLDGNHYGLITIICLGAVLDGAIFGDHCSPVSDTTIMSSIASACDHIDHVKTQLPYSLVVALVAFGAGYVPAAAGGSIWLSWGLALLSFTFIFLFVAKKTALHGQLAPVSTIAGA
ncbi:MAG: Na+/H+ antiporter NhaC family protein [Pseudomonadota bacterium]